MAGTEADGAHVPVGKDRRRRSPQDTRGSARATFYNGSWSLRRFPSAVTHRADRAQRAGNGTTSHGQTLTQVASLAGPRLARAYDFACCYNMCASSPSRSAARLGRALRRYRRHYGAACSRRRGARASPLRDRCHRLGQVDAALIAHGAGSGGRGRILSDRSARRSRRRRACTHSAPTHA